MKLTWLNINKYHFRHFLLVLAILIDCIVSGNILVYSATLLPQLEEKQSEIYMTENQGTWIASIVNLACIPGAIIGSILTEWIGRKWTYSLVAFGHTIGWLLISFSTKIWHILLARSIQGFGLGISYAVCLCFISEVILTTKYRSCLLNLINIGMSIGMLCADVMGTLTKWRHTAYVLTIFSLLYFLIFLYLKNTYVWYLNRNLLEEAKEAYFWYAEENDKNRETFMKRSKDIKSEKVVTFKQYTMEMQKAEFIKPLLIVSWFYALVVFAGGLGISLYSVSIMKNIVTINEYLTTIIIDLIRISASIGSLIMIKFLPMRVIVNVSWVISSLSLFILCGALYLEIDGSSKLLSVVSLIAIFIYQIFYNAGLVNICNISLGELFTGITKSIGISIAIICNFGLNFILGLYTPTMFHNLGNIWTFFIFGVCCTVGGIGMFLFFPETRNVSNEEIRKRFMSKKT